MSEAAANNNENANNDQVRSHGHTKTNGRAGNATTQRQSHQDTTGLIDRRETLRASLRDTLARTKALLTGPKRHRRQSRALENTIASLRQLKTLGV